LSSLTASLGPARFVVFGVTTEYCVQGAALALRERRMPVELVTDAIRAITQEGQRKAIEEMQAAGVRLVTTAQVCGTAEGRAVGSPEARA
jgi:nicotinamidase-related amidase